MGTCAQHVAIAGAGIIGLAAALELADAGFGVTVFDRGCAMGESSWAAAGMLAVEDPENPPELRAFSQYSRALYPEFLARVEQLSGLRVPLRSRRTLQGAKGHAGRGQTCPELPELDTGRFSFACLEEASLDPRDLCATLPSAARAAGAVLREHCPVVSVSRSGERLAVELAAGERVPAHHFILAAGAWSGQVRLPGESTLPVAPRKGQMIEITLERGLVLPVVVRTPELYLVPRGDGRVAIGATVERAGFDRTVDAGASERLWRHAAALWPPIAGGRLTAQWTGLRPGLAPGSEDALPVVGLLGGNLWAATGHFRNGILLAPGTARVLRSLLQGEQPAVALDSLAPGRFAQCGALVAGS